MNKIERLSAILIKLQSRKYYTTAEQMAEQFGVSLRTIYRDLRILEESGVPFTAVPGIGYTLVDGYKLPPLMLTTEEAIAFLMAETVVSQQADPDIYDIYRNGMDKIRTALKTSGKDILESFEENIRSVDKLAGNPEIKNGNIVQPLLHCIIEKRIASIEYQAGYNRNITHREIEPAGVFFMANDWYVTGWCRLRDDYRVFKLSRIRKVSLLATSFRMTHPPLKKLLERFYVRDVIYTLRIRVTEEALQYMGNAKFNYGLILEEKVENGETEQTYRIFSLEFFSRWFLSFADKATILEPEELKDTVRELVSRIKV